MRADTAQARVRVSAEYIHARLPAFHASVMERRVALVVLRVDLFR